MKLFNISISYFILCMLGIISFMGSIIFQAEDGDISGVMLCFAGCIWIVNLLIKK